jgi:hypothetical protein
MQGNLFTIILPPQNTGKMENEARKKGKKE